MPADLGTSSGGDPDMFHLANIGRMIESNEGILRGEIMDIYVAKQRQITNSGRLLEEFLTHAQKL